MIFFKRILIVFTVVVIFSLESVPYYASAALVSLADHCTALAADYSTSAAPAYLNSSVHSLTGFYYTSDGKTIHNYTSRAHGVVQNSVVFRFRYDGEADEQGLLRVQGNIEFPEHTSTYLLFENTTSSPQATESESTPNVQDSKSFKLNGIWSEASGELCMVGSGSHYSKHGNLLELPVVLKLYKLKNSSSLTSLISGTLESLVISNDDSNYFGPISISMLPSMNYQYTLALNKSHESSYDGNDSSPSSLKIGRFCSVISNLVLARSFQLKYPSRCLNLHLAKSCSPLSVSYLPAMVSLNNIECLEDKQKMRVLIDFSGGYSWDFPFNPSYTLVGEGSWDSTKNQVVIVACPFLNATDSLNTSHLGDCSVRLSFRFPAMWTIGNFSSIMGQIWSNQTATESDYFEKITFESGQTDVSRFTLPGQEYEYTKIDQVTKLCQRKKTGNGKNVKKYIYPHPFSPVMIFHISAINSTGQEIAWGYSVPLSVGNQFYFPRSYYSIEDGNELYPLESFESPPVNYTYNQGTPHNISYRIEINARGHVELPKGFYILNSQVQMVISAEGMYDDTEGRLCMVGCRDLSTNIYQQPTSDSIDCEMVVHFQFRPPSTSFIIGSIESTRNKSDPLYFERVELTAAGYSFVEGRSMWRMDVEIILDYISRTVACVSGILQLFLMKKHPEIRPFISICMLYILGLGYMLPLYLDVHISQALFLETTGRPEFLVLVFTAVNFLLPLRILRFTILARLTNGNQKEVWDLNNLALLLALPVYGAGFFFALFLIIRGERDYIVEMVSRYLGHDTLGTVLQTCVGLALDGFLLPQIVLNIIRKSKEKSLAASFFVGTTFVRILPHAYALYRDHTSAHNQLNDQSYIYPSSAASLYSTTWNVIVPCGCLLFAVITYLQQRFGGRCILPHKLRQLGA